MGVIDGTPVDAATTNPAFIDANQDDQGQGRYDFVNTNVASGPTVFNIQREINSLNSFTARTSGTAYNALPIWIKNQVGTTSDNLKDRSEALTANFDNSTGHSHNGTQGGGAPISAPTIANVPLQGYIIQGVDIIGVTGSSSDVSSSMTGKTDSSGPLTPGVVTTAPYNRLVLRHASGTEQGDSFFDGAGNLVYGRLTYASPTWTVSYYVMIGGTETSYSFVTASDISWYYQELYNPLVNPPVYSQFAVIPSDNTTSEVADATTTQKGKVQLSTIPGAAVSATPGAGTPNATVANADHSHEGVHSIEIDGDATPGALGDVKFFAGNNIVLDWVSGMLRIASNAGAVAYQETPAGTVDGTNAVFGPLTYTPSDNTSVLVMVDGVVRELTTAYTVSGSSITFTAGNIPQPGQKVFVYYVYGGTPSVPVISGAYRVEQRTVTSGEATAKAITLAFTPATPAYVTLDVIGGGDQWFGSDFTVTASTLSWNGLGLDGVLIAGDRLRITYVT